MTLHDLWLIIRHYAKWVIAVPLACMLLAGGYIYVSDHMRAQNFTATSTLTVTDPTALLGTASLSNLMDALAQNQVANLGDDAAATAKSDPATQSITFTVTGGSEEAAVAAANDMAAKTADAIKESLNEQADNYLNAVDQTGEASVIGDGGAVSSGTTTADRVAALRSCVFTISEAKQASSSASSGVMKYAAVGLVGGLFLVICALALMDSVRRPIKSKADIAEVTDLPVLMDGNTAKDGERLWANIQFSVADPQSVCVIPISGPARKDISSLIVRAVDGTCAAASGELANSVSAASKSLVVEDCASLNEEIAGACIARGADATVVVVRPWDDKAACLRDALSELQLARANVVGIALVK